MKKQEEWNELTKEEQRVILHKGTERAFTGEYNDLKENGVFICRQCESELYRSTDKFSSGCGWPSFDEAIKGTVKNVLDKSHGMIRTEVVCNNCGGHLGHVFNDGPTETGMRYCVNSISVKFDKE